MRESGSRRPPVKGTPALQVGVAGAQHRGEAGRFLLAAALFARLFKVPMTANLFESAFTVDLLLQTSQGLLDGLAFFKSNFGQLLFTSSPRTAAIPAVPKDASLVRPKRVISAGRKSIAVLLLAEAAAWEANWPPAHPCQEPPRKTILEVWAPRHSQSRAANAQCSRGIPDCVRRTTAADRTSTPLCPKHE